MWYNVNIGEIKPQAMIEPLMNKYHSAISLD